VTLYHIAIKGGQYPGSLIEVIAFGDGGREIARVSANDLSEAMRRLGDLLMKQHTGGSW
jgi:hypothetical protein